MGPQLVTSKEKTRGRIYVVDPFSIGSSDILAIEAARMDLFNPNSVLDTND